MAVNEHHANVRRTGRMLKRTGHLGVHRDRQRVHLLGPVDLNAHDTIGDFGEEVPAHRHPELDLRRSDLPLRT